MLGCWVVGLLVSNPIPLKVDGMLRCLVGVLLYFCDAVLLSCRLDVLFSFGVAVLLCLLFLILEPR